VRVLSKFRLLVAATAVCVAFSLPAPALAEGAAVRSVSFYPAGARFTYAVESNGSFEFDIPGAFDESSVRCLTLERLSSIKVERVAVAYKAPEELRPYELRVDEASKSLSLLEGRRSSMNRTLEFLSTPFSEAPYDKDAGFDGNGLIEYAKSSLKLRLELEAELVDANMGIERARKVLEEARREYEDAKSRLDRKKGSLLGNVIKARGTTDGPSKLVFEAFTPNAGWNVVYEMNLDSSRGVIDASMNSVVWQNTGTDVEGEFSFNTRQPARSIFPPEVRPLTVGLGENVAEPLLFGAASQRMEMSLNADGMSEKSVPVQAISTLSNVSVSGSGKIEGDGSAVRIKLGEFELECAPILISIPEQSRESWIVASIDVIPESFLPGDAELSVDDASTGNTRIAESVASAKIPFGMASRVTAKKSPYIRETGSSWIGTGILNDGYTIEVTNGMEAEHQVTVMDRVPFPTVDKVTVEAKKIDPEPDERDKENRLTWKLSLQPGETKKITVEYAIKYPGDETLRFW
jgi:uncharacterized protein (TIGR02231 family)